MTRITRLLLGSEFEVGLVLQREMLVSGISGSPDWNWTSPGVKKHCATGVQMREWPGLAFVIMTQESVVVERRLVFLGVQ